MNEGSDRLDKALDDALMSYGKAPENDGLEQRILVRVNERTIRARRTRLFAAAISTAAAAVVCLCWWPTPKSTVQTQPASKTAIVLRKPEALPEGNVPLRNTENFLTPMKRPRRSRKQRAEPKLPQFPMPSSVGSEERALLQLARYKAKYATQESSDLGNPVTPIEIAALEIKPIE